MSSESRKGNKKERLTLKRRLVSNVRTQCEALARRPQSGRLKPGVMFERLHPVVILPMPHAAAAKTAALTGIEESAPRLPGEEKFNSKIPKTNSRTAIDGHRGTKL